MGKKKQVPEKGDGVMKNKEKQTTFGPCPKILATIVIATAGILAVLLGVALHDATGRATTSIHAGIFAITPNAEDNAIDISITTPDGTRAVGKLGLSLPSSVGQYTNCNSDPNCFQWGDFATVQLSTGSAPGCGRIEWTSTFAKEIEDCYDLQPGVHWYGGGETHTQLWPIESHARELSPYVTGDFLQSSEYFYGGVVENYWLLSNGAAIVLDPTTPLYFSSNTSRPGKACFVAKDGSPYEKRTPLTMKYEWCTGANIKAVHQTVIPTFFGFPSEIPDETMLIRPLWSTWAEYKEPVNQTLVLEYARRVVSEGFVNTSHIEIDDHWETCYGQEAFNPEKFPDPKAMIDEIHDMGFKVTAWIHPFINYECPLFNEGLRNGYFVKDSKPRTGLTWWWQGREHAGIIDMTNDEATQWWISRLQKLQADTGLDSFKFDAGEVNWLPADAQLNNDTDHGLWPQLYTTKYVETCGNFGGLVETRTAHLNQRQPQFIRMLDKDSRWGYDNGLKSMITTLFHFSIVGYPFALPDMIGGNAYAGENPSKELFIRWMQVNAFMPAVQFSLVPWKYDQETVDICLEVLAKRETHRQDILQAARQATVDGSPMNRPLWWVDPTDSVTFTIDDEYMLGDNILVAPVVEEGAVSRDIYLPAGSWRSAVDGTTHEGKQWLRNYPAPLNVLPYFIKSD